MNLLNEFVFIHKLHTLYQILIHESSLNQGWFMSYDPNLRIGIDCI